MLVPIKKTLWSIYYIFLFLGLVYLVITTYSRWEELKNGAAIELEYLNRIFLSSVTLNFDQQEIMLDLLGRQILAGSAFENTKETRDLLDSVLQKNKSLIAFGLANLEGDITVGSSNLDLNKMPNLKNFEHSRLSFEKAAQLERMVLGRTYFLPAIDDLVIPIRKSIRDDSGRLIGMMTAGIKPRELLPHLDSIDGQNQDNAPYQLQIIHDFDFYYAYVSGISDKTLLRQIIDEPISSGFIEAHKQALEDQHGLSLEALRMNPTTVVFSAPGRNGDINIHSLLYLPKYQMWSHSLLPRKYLIEQLLWSISLYLITFLVIFGFAYFLFKRIDTFERKSRNRLSTTIKQLKQEMEEHAKLSCELENQNEELERFAYTVSHDLKTPLVTIKGFIGLLGKDITANNMDRIADDFDKINSAADTMGILLDDLLEHSRIGRVMGTPVTCDLTEIANHAAKLVQTRIDESGAKIDIQSMPMVKGDENRLVEVYQNLIENAVKFMGDQDAPRVKVGSIEKDGRIQFFVQDNGIGIATEYHDQVFGLFERLGTEVEGTGVGLALVKRIIEVHGGEVWVESEGLNHGCTVFFTLHTT